MKKKKSTIRIGIGQGSFVKKAIIDKNARIGRRVMVNSCFLFSDYRVNGSKGKTKEIR